MRNLQTQILIGEDSVRTIPLRCKCGQEWTCETIDFVLDQQDVITLTHCPKCNQDYAFKNTNGRVSLWRVDADFNPISCVNWDVQIKKYKSTTDSPNEVPPTDADLKILDEFADYIRRTGSTGGKA